MATAGWLQGRNRMVEGHGGENQLTSGQPGGRGKGGAMGQDAPQ